MRSRLLSSSHGVRGPVVVVAIVSVLPLLCPRVATLPTPAAVWPPSVARAENVLLQPPGPPLLLLRRQGSGESFVPCSMQKELDCYKGGFLLMMV
jgi:hypothetical protein